MAGRGQRIVRAILAGERDPDTLAALSHPGIHATRDTIATSLDGTWQPDLLFVLQQEVAMYDAHHGDLEREILFLKGDTVFDGEKIEEFLGRFASRRKERVWHGWHKEVVDRRLAPTSIAVTPDHSTSSDGSTSR